MDFPLTETKDLGIYSEDGSCAVCGSKMGTEFLALSQSAMERMENTNSYFPAEVKKSLYLIDHRSNSENGLHITEGISDIYFCSTKCLRSFFNTVVDEFEKR